MMANENWIVFACVRKEEDARRIQSKHTNIRPLYMDVTKQDQIDKALEDVRVAVGDQGLDALVNNAGLIYAGPAEFMPISDVQHQFDVNVFGVYRVTQAALPLLRIGEPGRIINISSIASFLKAPHSTAYAGSKAALDAFSEGLRREVARWGIKVSIVSPGPVESRLEEVSLKLSAELRDRCTERSKCDEYYGKDIDNFPAAAHTFTQHNAPTEKVASAVRSLLRAYRPKNVVYDTWGTWFTVTLLSWMPLWVIDRLLANCFIR